MAPVPPKYDPASLHLRIKDPSKIYRYGSNDVAGNFQQHNFGRCKLENVWRV